jgi:hypothetical protein
MRGSRPFRVGRTLARAIEEKSAADRFARRIRWPALVLLALLEAGWLIALAACSTRSSDPSRRRVEGRDVSRTRCRDGGSADALPPPDSAIERGYLVGWKTAYVAVETRTLLLPSLT